MDYCIKNSKNVYLKLNDNGAPVACNESVKGVFEYSKARNIINCLPKTLRKMNFKVVAILEPINKESKVIETSDYKVSDNIIRWVDKFGTCADILAEAKEREYELIAALDNADKELLDLLHIIEIEQSKDMFSGWKIYKNIKKNREKRRNIKDELLIVENVLREIDPSCMQRERVQKAVNGLFERKYTFRIVEDEENVYL